ncbi:hypothetical protein AWW71_04965 [Bacillus cereus]|uniref:hypothetical protein n=1 Tax=Bacillus cereus group TaxID=86661 RepID=UPI000762B558|nr:MULTISPECIES: hypothetical protein [Bacillus cereus group]KWU68451.1 hypothetical protein AWW71_04965 [Bacillus cereus]KWW50409.1 hypothetical protein AWW69_01630 [Bacillus cereus]MED3380605.1 hypothetical protein [Bacillus tropicus]
MGLFGTKNAKTITDTEFSWKDNKIKITDTYVESSGLINVVRVPKKHIETVTYEIKTGKVSISVDINLIGKGVVLGTIAVGIDLKEEIQDWLLKNLNLL